LRRMVTRQAVVEQLNAMQSAPIQEELPGVEPGTAEGITSQEITVVQDEQTQEQPVLERQRGAQIEEEIGARPEESDRSPIRRVGRGTT